MDRTTNPFPGWHVNDVILVLHKLPRQQEDDAAWNASNSACKHLLMQSQDIFAIQPFDVQHSNLFVIHKKNFMRTSFFMALYTAWTCSLETTRIGPILTDTYFPFADTFWDIWPLGILSSITDSTATTIDWTKSSPPVPIAVNPLTVGYVFTYNIGTASFLKWCIRWNPRALFSFSHNWSQALENGSVFVQVFSVIKPGCTLGL